MEIKGKTIGTGKPLLCVPVMESNKEEIIGIITSNQLPSPEILKEHPAEHRTASASF